ncbi:MAG: TAXI family TRAP transporter solute-binding subunit [Rhizobiaceae bacterium]|nr:TAXI family TRAP transporter solute-binding subunit [Rhizobiaceae bacterium]MCV0405636.1 TAXI family TRAP transporter solute-binding subunit [Rhizobiaceae bacterium]
MHVAKRLAALAAGAAMLAAAGQAVAQDFYRLATLGPGSSPYMVMSTFAQLVGERTDAEIQVNATGAATQHAIEVANGQLDFFMWSATVHASMQKGINMYAQIPQAPDLSKNLRAVFAFPLGLYHMVVYADSDIKELADANGKRVFLGPPGGGATVIMGQLMEAVTGMKPNEGYTSVQLGWEAALQSFQDGRIDLYINPSIPPSPVIEQITISNKVRLLGLSEEDREKEAVQAILNRPGGVVGEIAPDVYGDNQVNEEAVTTLGSIVGVGTGVHMDDDAVYEITKAFWEGVEESRDQTRWLREISLESAFRDLNLPLHPGAERYYREIGVEIPDHLVAK